MLQQVLASHSQIATHPEPHLMTPLAYLGYYEHVDKAPYDVVNSAAALREFVDALPHGEDDYVHALRAMTDSLYLAFLQTTNKTFFVDKTPAYALILPFLTKLYPDAHYVVLTRHPAAILHSVAHSFFDGDYQRAHAANPILERYVPAIAHFLRQKQTPYVHLCYEDLVQEPKAQLQKLCHFLNITFEPGMIEYGAHKHVRKSFGDPIGVHRHTRPVGASRTAWATQWASQADVRTFGQSLVDRLDAQDLQIWGYAPERLWQALQIQTGRTYKPPRWSRYQIKRKALLAARRKIKATAVEKWLRSLRYACDLLIRE